MKIKTVLLAGVLAFSCLLTACGNQEASTEFETQLADFTEAVEKLDHKINSMDVELPDYDERLLNNLDEVADVFSGLVELHTDEYEYYDELAQGADYYMGLANEYYHRTFAEDGYHPEWLETANAYYAKAIQYVRYIGYMMNDYDVSEVAIPLDQLKEREE